MSNVIVIGGGLAGLAASVALAQSGVSVTLLESRPRLGGRASSFEDSTNGELIDNCQHVAMGCCTNFQHFCCVTKLESFFRTQDQLTFVGPPSVSSRRPPQFIRFAATPFLPAPFHLGLALCGLSYLTWSDKLAIGRGLFSLQRSRQDDDQSTFAEWLLLHRQPANAVNNFWNVVLVSALSESLDRISVSAARKVFVDGFLTHRDAWKVSLPTVPLDELYSGALSKWLADHDVEVRTKAGVERVVLDDERISAVDMRSGERLTATHFVMAVPHQRVPSLLPDPMRRLPQFSAAERLETAPIGSVHLWFDRPITNLPHAVLVGRLSQWLFNRSAVPGSEVRMPNKPANSRKPEHETRNYYQVVISNARDVANRPSEKVIEDVVTELKAIWPHAAEARLLHSRMIIEHHAVFSPRPGINELRPLQQSPIANLQLAGDWTQTGWPATMEGAVRSGFLAAENILAQIGRPAKWLQSDLQSAWSRRRM